MNSDARRAPLRVARTRVEVRRPARGDKRRILEMAVRNAALGLEHEQALEEARRNRVASTLDGLREDLALPKLPVRIECYDISNTMGTNSVASMVVFQGGRPAKDEYRRFRIRTVEGADDPASMAEVIRRRLERLRQGDEKFLPAPDLILLDGGKGQLSAVAPVFEEYGVGEDLGHPPALARQARRRGLRTGSPGAGQARTTPRSCTSPARPRRGPPLRQSYHRVRTKAMTASVLDELPGVGATRKKRILDHFGTPEAFLNLPRRA